MPQLILLGSAASVPDAEHDTVSLVLCGPGWSVLIDCGGSPLYKLARLGMDRETIHAVILTHGHADHLYGLPILVQGLWLGGREAPLPVYGPRQALDRAHRLLELLDLIDSDRRLSVEWHPLSLREGRQVLEVGEIRITASPCWASSLIMWWTSALAPTSMPRVGSSRISTLGSAASHFARTTFC
jgi:ribonuclease Z